tara:strand:- start:112 stop:1002 length:891 start_codon:yes stop_codon:yes gene_type:complete
MSTYLLHDDLYSQGNFDLTLAAVDTTSSQAQFVTKFPEANNITDPREFNSTKLYYGFDIAGVISPYKNLDFIFTANTNSLVDYVAFNKHNFGLVNGTYNSTYIEQIQIIKWVQPSSYTSLSVHIPAAKDKKNLVMKFDQVPINAGESIIVRFKLRGYVISSGTTGKKYGYGSLRCSYIQIGRSTKLRNLKAPLNIPIDSLYETKNIKSDTGEVIGTSSKEKPIPINLNLKNMDLDFVTEIKSMIKDMTRHPFFIYDESGTLPNVPFCWITKKMNSPKLNNNHLYDLSIKAQAKIYE